MENRTLARRYARVLLRLDPKGELHAPVAELSAAIHQKRHVLMVFQDPMVPGQTKLNALRKAYGTMPAELWNFLEFVKAKNRLDHLPLILSMYLQGRNRRDGVVLGQVRSALPLGAEQIARLESAMSQKLGRECHFGNQVDSRLLAGFSIHIEDTVYDHSVRGQLDRLRAQLIPRAGRP